MTNRTLWNIEYHPNSLLSPGTQLLQRIHTGLYGTILRSWFRTFWNKSVPPIVFHTEIPPWILLRTVPPGSSLLAMDAALALKTLALILKGKAKALAFLAKHPELSVENPEDALRLISMATTAASAPRQKPQLPLKIREFRRQVAKMDFERILHTAKTLALCSLPVEPTTARTIEREAIDEQGLKVRVNFSTHKANIALPYGNDRAIITWLMTLAREHGSPKVQFDSAMEFFSAFGIGDSGRNYVELREALERICNVVITYGYESELLDVDRDKGEKLVYDKQLPSRRDVSSERLGLVRLTGLPNYFIEFGDKTFKELVSSPVSIPLEILRRYRNNPTNWDLLNFIVAESAGIESGGSKSLSLSAVVQFLGSQDKNLRKLKLRIELLHQELGDFFNFSIIGRGTSTVLVLRELPEELRPKPTLGVESPKSLELKSPQEINTFEEAERILARPTHVSRFRRIKRRLPPKP